MATDPMWCFENYGSAAEWIDELEAKNAALKEQLSKEQEFRRSQAKVNGDLAEQLAAAQDTIEQMREALIEAEAAALFPSATISNAHSMVKQAIALPTNLDALHEALAKAVEKFGQRVVNELEGLASEFAMNQVYRSAEKEAAAHRARKEAK